MSDNSRNRILPDKSALLQLVKSRIESSAESARQAMDAAQEAANGEGKSSMGDKYETGRSMAQLDRDLFAGRYHQIMGELEILARISADPASSSNIKLGSLAETSAGWVLIAVSLGVVALEEQKVLVVSTQSPLGRSLLGKSVGDSFPFQGKQHRVMSVQ